MCANRAEQQSSHENYFAQHSFTYTSPGWREEEKSAIISINKLRRKSAVQVVKSFNVCTQRYLDTKGTLSVTVKKMLYYIYLNRPTVEF